MDKQMLTVYKKEVRELMRDRRVRSSAIIGPFLMVFVMMSVMGAAIKTATSKGNVKIHIVKPSANNLLLSYLQNAKDEENKNAIVLVDSVDEGKQLLAK